MAQLKPLLRKPRPLDLQLSDEPDEDLSPLLNIPVSACVVTPSATPPSPWMASTSSKPQMGVSRLDRHLRESQTTILGSDSLTLKEPSGSKNPETAFKSIQDQTNDSLGLLPVETLADDSAGQNSATPSLLFGNLSSLKTSQTRSDREDVFKVPSLPPHILNEKPLPGIDQRFLQAQALLPESFLSLGGNSTINQSSFAWEKILQNESKIVNSKEVNVEVPLNDDESFASLNQKHHDSFFNGQFSARSTSFGGSNEGNDEGPTRDERFSDFSQRSKLFQNNPAGSFLEGPEGFAGLSQDLGDVEGFGDGDFESDMGKAHAFMDEQEKEFLQFEESKTKSNVSGFSVANVSFKMPLETDTQDVEQECFEAEEGDVMSRSKYFMQNSSRLGALDSTLTGLNRPDLGFDRKIESPEKDEKDTDPKATDSTYTLSSGNSTQILDKVDAFKHMDLNTLQDLIAKASKDHNPAYYATLIAKFAQEKIQSETMNGTVSELLPSFLETSKFPDETQTLEIRCPSPTRKNPSVKKSRIPVRSPKQGLPSQIPIRKGSAPNLNAKKKAIQGPRFSSPNKRYPRSSSQVENTTLTKVPSQVGGSVQKTLLQMDGSVQKISKNLFSQNEGQGQNQENQENTSPNVQGKPAMPFKGFPIDSDRSVMNWFGVSIGRSEEQIVVLRNKLEQPLTVNLMIRDSKDFKIGLSTSQSVQMGPLSTQDIAINFSPPDLEACSGKLVIKPQGTSGPGNKAFKASILLQGQGGTPALSFSGFGDLVNGKRSLHLGPIPEHQEQIVRKMRVTNDGNGDAFVKLQGFRDDECRLADNSFIRLSPSQFVVSAKSSMDLSMAIDPNLMSEEGSCSFIGSIALFHGPEICRQVMLEARKIPGAIRLSSSSALLGLDFTTPFQHSKSIQFSSRVVDRDVKHFYSKTQREIIELIGQKSNPSGFNSLHVEETLSESRINCTFAQDRSMNPMQTIQEIRGEPEPTKKDRKPLKTVYLAAETIFFPLTKIGTNALAKIVLKNRTPSPVTFHLEDISPPFKNRHKLVTVQANSFLNVPVFYSPTNVGPHQTAVTFKGSEGRNLVAVLKGNTSPN
ncbi:hypothetical protein TCAL_15555 [Tigriopus californicus]|uniref:Uncharacterized protein n=1 Tax=Tigriopus californicus TaxID=6832 RepID=A0A553PAH3_TIGCA|nr:uncharacterized protein LOC131892931 [Tigriopus californicus]TRY74679.1 hypothetical protein TCAL_15555 [Tigriopus californicus]